MEEVNIDIGVNPTNYFSHSNKKYPFCLAIFSVFSKYFKDQKIEDNQVFPLLDSTEQTDIVLNDSSIINFNLFCQNKNYIINNENAIFLHYLAIKYDVSMLTDETEKYIEDHYLEFKAQVLSYNSNIISKHLIEESISHNLKAEINSNWQYLIHIPIESLYRILSKYYENNPTERNNQEIIEFLFKVLKEHKKEASVLFSLIDFSTRRTEYIDRLLTEFSNDFDFHFINPLFLKTIYQKENELILKEEEIEVKISRTFDQIRAQQNDEVLSLKSEVNQLRSQVSLLSQIVSEQRSQINNLIGGIENLKLVCLEPKSNKGILFNLKNEVDLSNEFELSNGGVDINGYRVSNLLNDDLNSDFCNYDCNYNRGFCLILYREKSIFIPTQSAQIAVVQNGITRSLGKFSDQTTIMSGLYLIIGKTKKELEVVLKYAILVARMLLMVGQNAGLGTLNTIKVNAGRDLILIHLICILIISNFLELYLNELVNKSIFIIHIFSKFFNTKEISPSVYCMKTIRDVKYKILLFFICLLI